VYFTLSDFHHKVQEDQHKGNCLGVRKLSGIACTLIIISNENASTRPTMSCKTVGSRDAAVERTGRYLQRILQGMVGRVLTTLCGSSR